MQVVASTTSWECSEPHVLELSLSRWNHGSSSCLNECAAVQRQECVLCSCFMLRRCAAVASDKRADFCASCVRPITEAIICLSYKLNIGLKLGQVAGCDFFLVMIFINIKNKHHLIFFLNCICLGKAWIEQHEREP